MGRGGWWVGMCLLLGACREHPPGVIGDGGTEPPPLPPFRIQRPNPIPAENGLPGDRSWRSGRGGSSGEVLLYLSADSAAAGDAVAARVSTGATGPVTAEVFRIGYYGGAGARRVWNGGPFQASKQPDCPMDATTGRVECHWADAFSFTVGQDWVSGLYAVKVTRADGFRTFAPLVVRDDRAAELLYAAALNTSQAYNGFGGESLYQDDSGTMPAHKAREVSFDRPYAASDGLGKVWRWEAFMASFLEQYGYDVTYSSNLDFARFDRLLEGVGAVVTGSQDEYWLREERDQLDEMLASGGGSLAFFGADGGYWRVRATANGAGEPLRTIVCYKNEPQLDPVPYSTIRFRDSPDPIPESLLFGTMYEGWQLVPFPLVVADPSHWLLEGTGARAGDRFPGLLGYEYDRAFGGALQPPGLSVPLRSPVVSAEGVPSFSESVERTVPSGRLVFSAGSIYWPEGLGDDPERSDGRVQRMTLNVLERALSHRRPGRALPDLSGTAPPRPVLDPIWAIRVEPFAGVPGVAGARDGPGASATFDGPTGLAIAPQGVVVTEAGGNRIRLVMTDPDRTVSTIAGDGQLGLRDGPGATAQFRRPTGIAAGPNGALYVADSDNHCIRKIALDPLGGWRVSTLAGGARVSGTADGPALTARFNRPTALAVDAAGNLYVADQANHRIRRVDAATREVSTIAGSTIGALDSAVGLKARFNNPSAIAVSPAGDLYVMDAGNQWVRKISAGGLRAVTTLAGDPGNAFGEEDGTGLLARFRAQLGLAYGPSGELLLADMGNFRLRKLILGPDAASTHVHTIAGSGLSGTALGDGAKADLPALTGVAVLSSGQLIVSDSFHHVLRVVTR